MAEIFSQEEVDALLASAEELERAKKEKSEEKKTNPAGAESSEHLEQREKIKALLHDFYQERQKNMPVHREIMELAEKLKHIFEKVILFDDKFYDLESEVGESVCSGEDLPIRNEVIINWEKQGKKSGWQRINGIISGLQQILDKKGFGKELNEKEEKEISDIIKNIQEIDNKLNENVKKLWEIRKNIAKEIILASPEFSDFKDVELNAVRLSDGLYNLDSFVEAEKILETEEGIKKEILFFKTDDCDIKKALNNLEKKYNITEDELKEIKDFEWSEEEKENLKNLMEDVSDYKIEAEKLKQGLLKSANLKFKNEGADLVKDEFTRAFIRQSYEDYKLPVVHKERVVQEIMNRTFSF